MIGKAAFKYQSRDVSELRLPYSVSLQTSNFKLLQTAMKTLAFDVGIKGLSYCILSADANGSLIIFDWKVVDVTSIESNDPKTRSKKRNRPTTPELIRCFVQLLGEMFPVSVIHDVDRIVIETQNGAMRCQQQMVNISYMLYQYFYTIAPLTVTLVSANSKFKSHCALNKYVVDAYVPECKSTYTQRKNDSIAKARDLLELICTESVENSAYRNMLVSSLKSTSDAADSFMLAFMHI